MILATLALLPPGLFGTGTVLLLLPTVAWRPAWLRWIFVLALGFAVGAGFSSALWFVLLWMGLPATWLAVPLEALAGLVLMLLAARRRNARVSEGERDEAPQRGPNPWDKYLRAAVLLVVILLAADYSMTTSADPNGGWDAFAIWNARARFLAGGAPTWRAAVSPDLANRLIGASHPGYPLLTSALIAQSWNLLGSMTPTVPAAVDLWFVFAVLGTLAGGVAWVMNETCGLASALVLLATEVYVSQAASQYADLPLSAFIIATAVLLYQAAQKQEWIGLAALAGMTAALAAWTKNEGVVFLLIAGVVALLQLRGKARIAFCAGAAIPALVVVAFKISLAPPDQQYVSAASQVIAQFTAPDRWIRIAGSFLSNLWEMGFPWAHPILLMAVLLYGAGLASREQRRRSLWSWALPVGMLAADFVAYLLSAADLNWHLSTSNDRLLVQVWPALIFSGFLMMNLPVAAQPEPRKPAMVPSEGSEEATARKSRKTKRRTEA